MEEVTLQHILLCRKLDLLGVHAAQSSFNFVKPRGLSIIVADDAGIDASRIGGNVEIVHERALASIVSVAGVRAALPKTLRHRAGWYFQQFLKIHYALLSNDQKILISDADMIFLAPQDVFQNYENVISIVPHAGRPWNSFSEYIGILPRSNDTYVSEHILVSRRALEAYAFYVQTKFPARYFWQAICRAVSGFVARYPTGADYNDPVWADVYSEYQTLGNFVLRHFPRSTFTRRFAYCRFYPRQGYSSQTAPGKQLEAFCMEVK